MVSPDGARDCALATLSRKNGTLYPLSKIFYASSVAVSPLHGQCVREKTQSGNPGPLCSRRTRQTMNALSQFSTKLHRGGEFVLRCALKIAQSGRILRRSTDFSSVYAPVLRLSLRRLPRSLVARSRSGDILRHPRAFLQHSWGFQACSTRTGGWPLKRTPHPPQRSHLLTVKSFLRTRTVRHCMRTVRQCTHTVQHFGRGSCLFGPRARQSARACWDFSNGKL